MVNWQCGGAGTLDVESQLVEDGEVLELPGDITLSHGETMIAAEVFFDFDPLFGIGLGPRVDPPLRLLQAAPRRAHRAGLPGGLTRRSALLAELGDDPPEQREQLLLPVADDRVEPAVVLGRPLARDARAGASPSAVSRSA